MTIDRPSATITIDGQDLSLAESATAALFVAATTASAHDRATLTLGPGSPALDAAPDAHVEISMSAAGAESEGLVFTGSIARVAHQPWGTEVHALSASSALDRVHVGRAYLSRTVGDIVADLLGEAGVASGDVAAGATLPVFYVDEVRSAWRHVCRLASLVVGELTSAADGSINLRPARTGAAGHTYRAGAELLSWAVGRQQDLVAARSVGPFSAASEQGAEAWSLVHHDPGGSGAHLVHPVLRDRDLAQSVDDATAAARASAGGQGWAVVTGDASVRAGDLVELDSVERAEATYRVVTVRHQIDLTGFSTTLRLEGAA